MFQLLADSLGTFAGSIALTCADAASSSTCTLQAATVNLTSGGQTPIVLRGATATNAPAPFGKAPDVRPFTPTAPQLAASRWRGIVQWLLMLCAPIFAWDAIRANRRDGDSAFGRPGSVLWERHERDYAGRTFGGHLHYDGHRNIYRHRRQHHTQRAGDFNSPMK
jgi:hypothetical protein